MERIESNDKKKASFFQRLIAFVFDMVLISLIASIVSTPFINEEKIEKLENKQVQVINDYSSKKIDSDDYLINEIDIYYNINKANGLSTIITIFLEVLYFVLYQIYKNGQTLGKKIMKIRVISKDGDLSMNQMIFRTFISNFVLINIIGFIFMLFSNKDVYFYVIMSTSLIQYLIVIISIFGIVNKKDGCAIHDKLVHTEVIREN